jgi:RHS repeat-associated protein
MKSGHPYLSRLARVRPHHGWSAGLALLVTILLNAVGILNSVAAAAQTQAPTPSSGAINRTVPTVTPPSGLHFSASPSDAEFLRTGLFAEPLAPVAASTEQENRDLAEALLTYRDEVRRSGANDAVEPLVAFLAAHPDSTWKPALQLDLGIIYRQTGHFSKALDVWQAGWSESQSLTDPQARAISNAMVARLSQLEAYLGRKELLEPLLDSIQDRTIGGTAAQLITDSHTGLYEMTNYPEKSFRCGPLALTRILNYTEPQPSTVSLKALSESPSTSQGLSLSAVQGIAARAGMDYQMAFRAPGAPVLMPAVAHWKVGHYAAIVDKMNGRYLIQDTTFGDDIRMSPATLDEEASGYFLVPAGPLPEGWRAVSSSEGDTVWGRGNTGSNHETGDTGAKNCDCGGMTTATVEPQVVGLQLRDRPVGYTPPVGPDIRFEIYYSHRDTQQPATFSYSNFGPKWTFTWLSYITDTVNTNAQALLYRRGGGNEPYTFSSTGATTAYPGPYSQAVMTRTVGGGGTSTGFKLTYPDGSFEQFSQAVGNQFFMTVVGDAAGNTVTLTYDGSMRIVAITDALGQVSTLSYGVSGSPLLVTQITDPFGRSASFTYNGSGLLSSITDVLGITSSYTYGQGSDPNFINTLTTPYGSTTFTYGDSSTNGALGDIRFLKTVDPLGRTSYVEFNPSVDPGDSYGGVLINSSLQPTGLSTCTQYLWYRNTYIFDANQYALATLGGGLNHSLGKVIHWLHTSDLASTARLKESEKEPLENRIWYNYPAQNLTGCNVILSTVSSGNVVINGASSQPSAIARVLEDGSTQLQTFQYNAQGNLTQTTDPVGRQLSFTYDTNGVDRLTTTNTTGGGSQLLETRTYNAQHLPLTVIGANGKTAHYQYNSAGQLTRFTDQLGHATVLTYDASGHLKTIQGPINGAEYTFAYDTVSRVAAATDPAGSTIHFKYDAADRPISATYPDGTSSKRGYTLLDLTSTTDRLGQKTIYSYDADRELFKTTDPLSHTVQWGHNLAGRLASITDAKNHTTTLELDVQSRVVTKQYPDGTALSIAYQNSTSLVANVTDALNQTTDYTYNRDNTIAEIDYSANQPTASVAFSYDPVYPRPISMTDGTGTTTYAYYPVSALGANLLKTVKSPIAGLSSGRDTIVYSYDALNRITSYKINGGASQSVGFDALGRLTSASNPLDTFAYSYGDATARVSGVTSGTGPAAALTYFGSTGDELLQQLAITPHGGGSTLAQYGYTYNADDNVASFSVATPSAQTSSFGYDKANRLLSSSVSGSPQYSYGYDAASNIASMTASGSTQNFAYSATNALTTATYDANGNPTILGGNTYAWDGANRVASFANSLSGTSSTFTYDGLGRLVRIVDKTGGSVTADHSYLWCGSMRCLAHDNTQSGSPVSTQYFPQGVIVGGTSYYYVKDQLGSVRQLVTTGGSVAAEYTYDPYGNPTTLSGSVVSDIGYAGYFYHASSGLNFAMYRAYDPAHGRWLNRDPIGEAGGVNVYAYVEGNTNTKRDPSGEFGIVGAGIGAAIGGGLDLALQLVQDHGNIHCVNWGQVVGAAGIGALAGSGIGWLAGIEGATAVGGAGGALVPMAEAAFNYGTIQTIAGYEIAGVIGLDGSTYTMNIWALYGTETSEGLFSLANAIRTEAAAVGATDISITGNAIINPGIANMSASLAARLGFVLTKINPTTILLQGSAL